MSTHKHIDKICYAVLAATILLTVLFVKGENLGVAPVMAEAGYASVLFDDSKVHNIDIVMEDWENFLLTCENEEYAACSVIIDNEAYKNVGIRAKGNTSLSQVSSYGNDRYSFKIEFDCYEKGKSYHGLDKLSLNNIIQDNTYMKDYLTYRMMRDFDVAAPLCSYVYITVNGEDWGLYLAVEGVEESFLARNYGSDYGNLYKPDSMDMGGGRGNGGKFDREAMEEFFGGKDGEEWKGEMPELPEGFPGEMPDGRENFEAGEAPDGEKSFEVGGLPDGKQGFEGGMPGGGRNFEGGGLPDGQQDFEVGGLPDGRQDFEAGGLPDGQQDFEAGERPDGRRIFGAKGMFDGNPPEGREGFEAGGMPPGGGMFGGSDDVALVYSDDEYSSYKNIFDNAKTDISNSDKDRLIASLKKLGQGGEIEEAVDVEAVIRYFVVHNFVCNFDSYTGNMMHNYYLYEKDGKLSMIPWDYNLAFGGFEAQSDADTVVNFPIDSPVSGGTIEERPMLAWIFEKEEYTEMYHQYFAELIDDYFSSGYFENMISSVKEMIAPFVEKDPTKFCSYEAFEKGAETLKEFCLLRAGSVAGQLDGTIPSTSQEQAQDKSALVDASGISLSDMGAMRGRGFTPYFSAIKYPR
ncbi:MAG: CotH kinase family protein [Clostridium sp.]|nr:CotH kinase family protein [Clostridium sp.]